MTLNRLIDLALVALFGLLSACGTIDSQPTTAAARYDGTTGPQQQQLKLQLASGVYRCELGQRVEIQRDARNTNLINLNWQGNRYSLLRYDSTSGLPRYEDRQNGLLWIDLPWKSILLDNRSGQPLANECKATS